MSLLEKVTAGARISTVNVTMRKIIVPQKSRLMMMRAGCRPIQPIGWVDVAGYNWFVDHHVPIIVLEER